MKIRLDLFFKKMVEMFAWIITVRECHRTDISEGIDIKKTRIKRVWYFSLLVFLYKGIKYEQYFVMIVMI